MTDERVQRFVKTALCNMAEMGVTPSEIGHMVKFALVNPAVVEGMTKSGAGVLGGAFNALKGVGNLGKGLIQGGVSAANLAKNTLLWGLLLSGGLGVAGGYMGEQMLGPDEVDIKRQHLRSQIESIQQAAGKQRSELEAQRLVEEDEDGRSATGSRGRQALQISSAF